MLLKCNLPAEILQKVLGLLPHGERVRYSLASDLTLDRRFGQSYIVVGDTRVVVCDSTICCRTVDLGDIKEVQADELFGSGRLIAVTTEGTKALIYYSKAYVPEFALLCRVINDLVHGRVPELPDEHEPAYCPKCGSPLPERGASCPKCLPRFQVLMRLLGLLKPYRLRVTALVLVNMVIVASQMGPPYITRMIVDDVITAGNQQNLMWWTVAMLVLGVVLLGSRYVGGGLSCWLAARLVADLRTRMHTHLQMLRMQYFSRRELGDIVARVMNDTDELQRFLIDGLPYLLVNSVMFAAIAVVLLYSDWRLAILVFLPVPFLVSGGGWFWHRLIPMFHSRGSRMGALHSMLNESIHGIRVVKAFAQERRRAKSFGEANEKLFTVSYDIDRTFVGFSEVMSWVMTVGVTAVWYFAARRVGHDLTLGTLLLFIGYIWLFYGPLQWYTVMERWMTLAFSGAERIFGMLDSPREVYSSPVVIKLPQIRGAVEFKDVRFSYERGKEVMRGISFKIEPGEMIGFVGKSGAGKSTIINLICRFYDVDSGLITIDGHPIKNVRLEDLRRQIGMVLQEPFLFNSTIYDNIHCGSATATLDDVVRAAKAANAHEFILDKEDGYDTYIGEGGAALSGGEKQRIAIARAILYNPPILILDEATSSVDSETEDAIQQATATLISNRTTIAIAHRLATLKHANRLVVIDDGKVAEMGSHDELMAANGVYANLVKVQTEMNRLRGEVLEA